MGKMFKPMIEQSQQAMLGSAQNSFNGQFKWYTQFIKSDIIYFYFKYKLMLFSNNSYFMYRFLFIYLIREKLSFLEWTILNISKLFNLLGWAYHV